MESKSPYFQQHIKWGHCSEQSWGEPFLSSALLWYCVKHKTGQRRYRVTEEWIWGGAPTSPPRVQEARDSDMGEQCSGGRRGLNKVALFGVILLSCFPLHHGAEGACCRISCTRTHAHAPCSLSSLGERGTFIR